MKDKKVYKAVGVVEYEYNKSHIIRPKSNSLNVYRQPLNRCEICGYTSISPEGTSNTCPVCGNEMKKIKICSPLGFCVDYNMPVEDFNGSYDWYSPNSDIKLDCEQSLQECPQVNNMTIRNNIVVIYINEITTIIFFMNIIMVTSTNLERTMMGYMCRVMHILKT